MKTNKNIVYADETYEIIGMMYDIYDEIGFDTKRIFTKKQLRKFSGKIIRSLRSR